VSGHGLTADIRDDAPLAAYLAQVAGRLEGPRRRREAILAELSDGLNQATEDHRAAGLKPGQAAAAAIARFGTPQAVADGFAGELAISYARSAIVWFLATGPLVGGSWLLLLRPEPWRTGVHGLLVAIPVIPLLAIAIIAAGGTVATTGGLMRWLPETGPDRALAAAAAIAAICIIGDLTMITMLLATGSPTLPLGGLAMAASLLRVAASIRVWRHATRARSR
jgi:hypothetical protein